MGLLAVAGFLVWFPHSRLSLDGVLMNGVRVEHGGVDGERS
jgi:hypothetical protein